MVNIWQALKKPVICLAPMDGVTDTVFRQFLCSLGKPDLMFTEFTHVKSIYSHDQVSFVKRLKYSQKEKPLIAQIWGTTPELFEETAHLLHKLGFDGVDINMGCPEKSVIKKGAGSALCNTPKLAKEIIKATQAGAKNKIPVSVKTRLGFKSIDVDNWIGLLLSLDLDALTIHLRTTKELSNVKPHWQELKKINSLKQDLKSKTLVLGNGNILSLKEAHQKIAQYKLDGIMIGRGVFHDPYIFNPHQSIKDKSPTQKIDLLLKHMQLYQKINPDLKSFCS